LPFGIKDHNLIVLRPHVALRTKMRVAGGQPDVALFIHINARRRDEIGMLGQQREFDAGLQRLDLRRQILRHIGRLWRRAGLSKCDERKEGEEKGSVHGGLEYGRAPRTLRLRLALQASA
jgi:hypothetical protein